MRAAFEQVGQSSAAERGWAEYRAPAGFRDLCAQTYSYNNHSLRRFRETIKDAVDPNGILARALRPYAAGLAREIDTFEGRLSQGTGPDRSICSP